MAVLDYRNLMNEDGDIGVLDFVVKVQYPMFTTTSEPAYLVYNEERSFELQVPIGAMAELDTAMLGHLKRYFGASFVPDEEAGATLLAINPFQPVEDVDW